MLELADPLEGPPPTDSEGDALGSLVGLFLPVGILLLILGLTVLAVWGEATAPFLVLLVVVRVWGQPLEPDPSVALARMRRRVFITSSPPRPNRS